MKRETRIELISASDQPVWLAIARMPLRIYSALSR